MFKKEKNSVKIQYFLLGLLCGTFIIPKIKDSKIGSNNGNTYFITLKKDLDK